VTGTPVYPGPDLDADDYINVACAWLADRAADPDIFDIVQIGYRLALIALDRQASILRLSNELAARNGQLLESRP
jgi:hypothetical protein